MKHAAVRQMDVNPLSRRMAYDVPVGEHVELGAKLYDDARTGLFDVAQALELGQRFGFDVDDGRRNELYDALDEPEFAPQRFDIAGERRILGVALAGAWRRYCLAARCARRRVR
jgi:hypothetical protein